MFDIGFWEIAIIGLVALVVIGPERLPRVARTVGKWVGKGRSMVSSVKAEIDKELKADELKEILQKQAKSNPLHEIVEETQRTLFEAKRDTEKTLNDSKSAFESDEQSSAKETHDSK